MIRLMSLGFVLLTLVLFGCGQSEEPKSQQQANETVSENVAETVKDAAGEVKESAESVAEKAEDVENQAEPAIKDAVQDTKDMAAATADKTEEMASQAAEGTKQVMADTKDAATEAAVATTMAAEKAVDSAQQAVSPETIVLEASYGNVTFPHAMHQGSYACATCHGEGTPGLFGLDKDKAHALCKDCHKDEGAGPTSCKDCHKK